MKLTLLAIVLAFCLTSHAQTPPGIDKPILSNAILAECYNRDFPFYCNKQKLEDIISSIITDDLITDLPKENKKYFSLSCLFFTAKDGKVLPEFTEVRSESSKLKEAITSYLNSHLPELLPKNKKYQEQRSAHIVNVTYIRNPKTNGYYIASESDIKKNKIKPNYITYDNAPIFIGCDETLSYDEQILYAQKKISEHIKKNFRKPGNASLYVNMSILVIIDSDGKVNVDSILGSAPDEYEHEVYRLVNTLPLLKPAKIKGISSAIFLNLDKLTFQ